MIFDYQQVTSFKRIFRFFVNDFVMGTVYINVKLKTQS